MIRILSTLLLSFALVGCSLFVPKTQTLTISSNIPDAIVFVNGEAYSAPSQIEVPRDESVSIQAVKDGYFPVYRDIDTELSTSGVWDVAGGVIFLVPLIGLTSNGAWELEQDHVKINMVKNSIN